LLIDADLRDPSQHDNFGPNASPGLAGVLAHGAEADLAVVPTNCANLSLLPAGETPEHPGELLDTQVFIDLLHGFSKEFDYVVVDAPPILPVTDARILGSMCDASILVLRAGVTRRRGATAARDGLLGFGAVVLGIVINSCRRKRGEYSYYGKARKHSSPAPQQDQPLLFTENDESAEQLPAPQTQVN
jgi:capsular exopolysaccharide synthesis family protein